MNKTLIGIITFFVIGLMLSTGMLFISHNRSVNDSSNPTSFPERIICAVPNITEIVFALGQGHRVVGISEFTTYPPEALRIEKIGGYIDPNMERIIALQPDLIIVIGVSGKLHALCDEKGIQLLQVEIENLHTLYSGIGTIAEVLGCVDEGSGLVQEIKESILSIQQEAQQSSNRPNVFVCLSRMEGELTDMFTITNQTFLGEMVELAGGRNIFGDLNDRYPQISKESLLKREPDVIIDLKPEDINVSRSLTDIAADWNDISSVPAVSSGNIHIVTDDYIKIAGPRIVQSAQRLLQIIHQHE